MRERRQLSGFALFCCRLQAGVILLAAAATADDVAIKYTSFRAAQPSWPSRVFRGRRHEAYGKPLAAANISPPSRRACADAHFAARFSAALISRRAGLLKMIRHGQKPAGTQLGHSCLTAISGTTTHTSEFLPAHTATGFSHDTTSSTLKLRYICRRCFHFTPSAAGRRAISHTQGHMAYNIICRRPHRDIISR